MHVNDFLEKRLLFIFCILISIYLIWDKGILSYSTQKVKSKQGKESSDSKHFDTEAGKISYPKKYANSNFINSSDIELSSSKSNSLFLGGDEEVNSSVISIPPSKMKIHYWEMWNHTTSTIDVPDKYQNPFNLVIEDKNNNLLNNNRRRRSPRTSLEILQDVLHGDNYKVEFEAVETYILHYNSSLQPPSCLLPNVRATEELANKAVSERRQQQQQMSNNNQSIVQFLPLPIFNLGYPKVGTNTLLEYFDCIGLVSNHGQNGKRMFENLANGRNLFRPVGKYYKENSKLNWKKMADVFTELNTNKGMGFYPQISLLDELHELHERASFVFNFRPIMDWIRSVRGWNDLEERFSHFLVPGLVLTDEQLQRNVAMYKNNKNKSSFLPSKRSSVQLAKWWCGHVLHLREYVKEYPTHVMIELDLYDSNKTASVLHDLFQADYEQQKDSELSSKQCWGHKNKSPE